MFRAFFQPWLRRHVGFSHPSEDTHGLQIRMVPESAVDSLGFPSAEFFGAVLLLLGNPVVQLLGKLHPTGEKKHDTRPGKHTKNY